MPLLTSLLFSVLYFALFISAMLLPDKEATLALICSFLVIIVMCFVLMAVSVIQSVFYFMALYKIFEYTDKKNSTLYFVLSLVLMFVASFAFAPYIFLLIIAFGKKPIPDPYAEAEIPETL